MMSATFSTPLAISSENVRLKHPASPIGAYLAFPQDARERPYPALVLLQEIFGVNAHVKAVADRLARLGYVVAAPQIFDRAHPDFAVGYTDEDVAAGRALKAKTTVAELQADATHALEHLRRDKGFPGEKAGVIGFCFGGHAAFLAAATGRFQAAAIMYGGGLTQARPGGGAPSVAMAPELRGHLFFAFGKDDPIIGPREREMIHATLTAAHQPFAWHVYDAGHGFMCEARKDFIPAAAALAWDDVTHFLRTRLA